MAVPEIIASQQAYVTDWVVQANAFINQVANLANQDFPVTVPADLGYGRSGITDSAKAELDGQRPTRPTIPGITVTAPDAPTFDFTAVVPVAVLDFLKSAPVLSLPSAPSAVLPPAPTPPLITDPVIPEAPVVTIPASPSVTMPNLPTAPTIQLPFFNANLPVDDLVAPTDTFQFAEAVYESALLDATKAKLLNDILNGGYGIDVTDELAMWERARSREFDTAEQAVDQLIQFHAQRGFPLLPGDLSIAVGRAQQDLSDKVSSINRDIAIKRADLFVQNRQFTIRESKELEAILINFHNSIMERALNASKAVLEFSIQVFNALVARYNARVQSYQAEAQVFELKTRAALTQIEIFKAQIDAARLDVEVQRAAIDAYNAQIAGIQAVVGIYRTRMEAASIQAGIERLRLDAFRGLVDAYAQQVQAKVAEFNMYKAQIEGETAKITAFEAEVSAYNAQVQGSKVKADVQVANLNAETEQARTRLAGYQAQIEQFRATLTSQVAVLNATIDTYKADISAFATSVDALKSAFQLQVQELGSNITWNTKAAEINLESARVKLEALVRSADVRLHASEFGSNFYKSIVEATLGSITTLAAEITNS
jgi:predicted  nucleic acid-binding Zn-ribbon protein